MLVRTLLRRLDVFVELNKVSKDKLNLQISWLHVLFSWRWKKEQTKNYIPHHFPKQTINYLSSIIHSIYPFIFSLGRSEYLRHGGRTSARSLHLRHVLPLGEREGTLLDLRLIFFALWSEMIESFWSFGLRQLTVFSLYFILFLLFTIVITFLIVGMKCEIMYLVFI